MALRRRAVVTWKGHEGVRCCEGVRPGGEDKGRCREARKGWEMEGARYWVKDE